MSNVIFTRSLIVSLRFNSINLLGNIILRKSCWFSNCCVVIQCCRFCGFRSIRTENPRWMLCSSFNKAGSLKNVLNIAPLIMETGLLATTSC